MIYVLNFFQTFATTITKEQKIAGETVRINIIDGTQGSISEEVSHHLLSYNESEKEIEIIGQDGSGFRKFPNTVIISRITNLDNALLIAKILSLDESKIIYKSLPKNVEGITVTLVLGKDFTEDWNKLKMKRSKEANS